MSERSPGVGSPAEQFLRLQHKQEELDQLCRALTKLPPGAEVTVPLPDLTTAQHGFLLTVLWLHAWLAEAWGSTMEFLLKNGKVVDVEPPPTVGSFPWLLSRLRTFLVHNLDSDDQRTLDVCQTWFYRACGSRVPGGSAQWGRCLMALLQEAIETLDYAISVVRAMERHEHGEDRRVAWESKLQRGPAALDFHVLLETAAANLGLDGLSDADFHGIARRHQDQWTEVLTLRPADSDFQAEAIRLIERTLLGETTPILPVPAQAIMDRLGLDPGKDVAVAVRLAQVLQANEELPEADLLSKLEFARRILLTDEPVKKINT